MAPTSTTKIQPSLRTITSTTRAGAGEGPGKKGGTGKLRLPKVTNNFVGPKRVGRISIPPVGKEEDSTDDDDSIGKRCHKAQKKAVQKKRRAVKAREAKTLSTIPDGPVKEGMKKLEVLTEVPGSAAMRFAAKKPQGMDTFWELAGEDTWEEALEVALEPEFSEGAVYLAILGNSDTISVVHSLCRLETPLRVKNPVIGKVAAFVGEVRPKDSTPNMVYFDEDTELASKELPVVSFDKMLNHLKRHGTSPDTDELVDEDNEQRKEVSPLIPVPSEWAPFFFLPPPAFDFSVPLLLSSSSFDSSSPRSHNDSAHRFTGWEYANVCAPWMARALLSSTLSRHAAAAR